jgi:hypothetical protein
VGKPVQSGRPWAAALSAVAVASFAFAFAFAFAAPAGAQTISAASACYVNVNPMIGAPVTLNGSGWTAGDDVEIKGGGVDASATVGADGTFTQVVAAPLLLTSGPAQQRVVLNAYDRTTGLATATTSIRSANLALSVRPMLATPDATVHFSFSGFLPDRPIYAHYLHGRRVVAEQAFGTTMGACGLLADKAPVFPGGVAKFSRYTVQFDDSRRYRLESSNWTV